MWASLPPKQESKNNNRKIIIEKGKNNYCSLAYDNITETFGGVTV